MPQLHLRLVIDVVYNLKGEAPDDLTATSDELVELLGELPSRAANIGWFTGETPATVDNWESRLVVIPNPEDPAGPGITVDDFISELADGDSNDREIDCLTSALREAEALLEPADVDKLEVELRTILDDN